MAVFTQETVRANVRVRDGKRVFYLDGRDHLTPAARDWLRQDGVEILSAELAKPRGYTTVFGGTITDKPEHMTHLYGNVLVPKDHPRIRFRGALDSLEAEVLLTAKLAQGDLQRQLLEILDFLRMVVRCDVLGEPLPDKRLCGLTQAELREQSHFPQKYFDQPHFMPSVGDSGVLLSLNRLRTLVRQCELCAYEAHGDGSRPDMLRAMNRLSSLVWILMIRQKKEETAHG